jgi:hypothetical protein
MTMNQPGFAALCAQPDASPPWYRQRWPWLLIAGPAVAVVAGFFTLYLAISTDDGVIADDYYKRGLLINKELLRSQRAEAMGLSAIVHVAPSGAVRVELAAAVDAPLPDAMTLKLVHPTRSGQDREAALTHGPGNVYVGDLGAYPAGRWFVSIETPQWRLPAAEISGGLASVTLGSGTTAN